MSEQLSVAPGAVEAFRRDGYYVHRHLMEPATAEDACAWLRAQNPADLAKSWTEQEPGVPLAVFSVAHIGDHPIARIAAAPSLGEVASTLLGAPVYMWASKVNLKAAWCGTVEYFHQDLVYWKDRGYRRHDLMTGMVFLQSHTARNGALHVMSGTHRLGFIEHEPFVNINGLAKYMVPPPTLARLHRDHGIVAIEGEPGDAVFFHGGVVHGSSHNISPESRMVVISQFNVVGNEPVDVASSARQFNLRRAEFEVAEAERRHNWFKRKYEEQRASNDVTFAAPIPGHERQPSG
ncbi:MAG: phytanoyl-CoA dioxygenase family protein [Vicinamibacterales bacterium]|jgi:ectoine hydroxylase|nr:phytanoyl-CoA dioxygenase family protein [Vicinamibacterales bacterium]